jgi:hypothetical protein
MLPLQTPAQVDVLGDHVRRPVPDAMEGRLANAGHDPLTVKTRP